MSNHGWTPERKAKQAAAIHRWRPWRKAGVKSAAGKAISKMNALKHGARAAEVRKLSRVLSEIAQTLKTEQEDHDNDI